MFNTTVRQISFQLRRNILSPTPLSKHKTLMDIPNWVRTILWKFWNIETTSHFVFINPCASWVIVHKCDKITKTREQSSGRRFPDIRIYQCKYNRAFITNKGIIVSNMLGQLTNFIIEFSPIARRKQTWKQKFYKRHRQMTHPIMPLHKLVFITHSTTPTTRMACDKQGRIHFCIKEIGTINYTPTPNCLLRIQILKNTIGRKKNVE